VNGECPAGWYNFKDITLLPFVFFPLFFARDCKLNFPLPDWPTSQFRQCKNNRPNKLHSCWLTCQWCRVRLSTTLRIHYLCPGMQHKRTKSWFSVRLAVWAENGYCYMESHTHTEDVSPAAGWFWHWGEKRGRSFDNEPERRALNSGFDFHLTAWPLSRPN